MGRSKRSFRPSLLRSKLWPGLRPYLPMSGPPELRSRTWWYAAGVIHFDRRCPWRRRHHHDFWVEPLGSLSRCPYCGDGQLAFTDFAAVDTFGHADRLLLVARASGPPLACAYAPELDELVGRLHALGWLPWSRARYRSRLVRRVEQEVRFSRSFGGDVTAARSSWLIDMLSLRSPGGVGVPGREAADAWRAAVVAAVRSDWAAGRQVDELRLRQALAALPAGDVDAGVGFVRAELAAVDVLWSLPVDVVTESSTRWTWVRLMGVWTPRVVGDEHHWSVPLPIAVWMVRRAGCVVVPVDDRTDLLVRLLAGSQLPYTTALAMVEAALSGFRGLGDAPSVQ